MVTYGDFGLLLFVLPLGGGIGINMENKKLKFYIAIVMTMLVVAISGLLRTEASAIIKEQAMPKAEEEMCLLTEPILQNADMNSVIVQWFTEGETKDNKVILYERNKARYVEADSYKLSRVRGGKTEADCNDATIKQNIWKHTAKIDNLPDNEGRSSDRIGYKVISDGMKSGKYYLASAPKAGVELKILLTSDLQLKKMCSANIQKVYETVGRVDGVWINGDIVDIPDRAYDWFYADNSFFKVMTGKADDEIGGKKYTGSALLQYAPLYTSIGNHDVMGVYDETTDLSVQFNSPRPREAAEKLLELVKLGDSKDGTDVVARFLEDKSYNTITYEEMFELPESDSGKEKWYGVTIGDIRLIALDVARVWRLPNIGLSGKYSEIPASSENDYGYGDFIFERIDEGSKQLEFLKEEILSEEYKNAKYRVVMFHSEAHSLGNNQIPPFTKPVPKTVTDTFTGLPMVIYDYPIEEDYIIKYVESLLTSGKTNLLFNGHSHIWNRFKTESGMNILESSNVGNTYGGFCSVSFKLENKEKLENGEIAVCGDGKIRTDYPESLNANNRYSAISKEWDRKNYVLSGDSNGLEPIMPNVADLPEKAPFLASNTITAFSVLDTKKGTVDSYYFDTENPESEVVLFDSFTLE